MPGSIRKPAIVVHGGAGDTAAGRYAAARAGCTTAVRAGLDALAAGSSALDAAIAAVRVLEDDPTFNAGIGAVLTRDGTVELDAAVMDGATLRFGAIAAMPAARRPIDIARAVLDDGEHVLLCGAGAWAFARERGFEPCSPDELITERARQRLELERARRGEPRPADPGTVGACVVDAAGHVAAATSTGGTTFKRSGRIGDTPLCGCGTYADDASGAASATGHGESIIRVTMARSCADAMASGASAGEAAWRVVDALSTETRITGTAGIICVDRFGRVGAAHNTATMAYAAGVLGGRIHADVRIHEGFDLSAALLD